MSDATITVTGLSKKYRLKHLQERQRYTALRDVIANRAMAPFRKLRSALSGNTQHSTLNTQPSSEDFWALKDVSFEVKQGEVMGIIGRNGAGKSTLLKVLSRITEPTEGRVRIQGRVTSLLEVGTGFHPELTGRENIFLNGAILGMTRVEIKSKFDQIVAFAEVEKFLDLPVKRYSSGMYVRLAFAVAAHLESEILIVDEVLAVGDAEFQKKCMTQMREAVRSGRTVLFVSHQIAAVENLCRTALLLERGQVKLSGPVSGVISAYQNDIATATGTSLSEGTERHGNGLLRFTGVRFVDEQHRQMQSLSCGSSIAIEFQVKNHAARSLRQMGISIWVESAIGQALTVWSTSYGGGGDLAEIPSSDFVVRLTLPRLALMPGAYTFYLCATVNGEVVDWLRPGGTFHVEAGDFYGTGQLPGNKGAVFLSEHSFEIVPIPS